MGKRKKEQLQNTTTSPVLDQKEEEENEAYSESQKKIKKKKKKKETIDVKILTLREQSDKTSPLVGYFPTGFDPLKNGRVEAEASGPPDHSVRVYRNVKRNNRLQVVVSPNGSQVDFVGTNYSGEGAAPQLCTYALGVLDKATQTLKIVPIAANKIFRLEPKLSGSDVSQVTQVEAQDNSKEVLNAEETAEKLRDLTFLYSTKKTINKTKKLESLRQKQDPRSQKDLDSKLEDIEINKDALEVAATTNARNIPPHDISASTPEKAYPLEKIIFEGEWNYLKDLLEIAEVAPDVYPSFVCNRVYKLEEIKHEYEMGTLACVFSYITHLIKFKDKHSMDGHLSAKNHKIPSIFSQKFRAMFGESDKKRLSDEKRNLLISYVLVLTLFADGYRSDPSDIAKDLRMNAIELRTHYEQLGCKFVREGTVLLATLPVPLQFPVIRIRRKRQR